MSRLKKTEIVALQKRLLAWYDRHQRIMPWRAAKGQAPDPYHVWLSEVMLQQTTVAAVGAYFERFTQTWPTVHDLAAADLDDVLTAWAGLGYYARARNLHKCAKVVALDYQGRFPRSEEALLALPGIGPYTAAAISSIAFNRPAVAVDGNVERVVSRFFAVQESLPRAKAKIRLLAADIAEENGRPRDFTQAFMELGATVCTPRRPKCGLCPWQKECRAKNPEDFPRKEARAVEKPVRYGRVFWVCRKDKKFLIEKRKGAGLYEGLYQLPTTEWLAEDGRLTEFEHPESVKKRAISLGLSVRHSFTHFDLVLEIWKAEASAKTKSPDFLWISAGEVGDYALPSLMKKAIRLCVA